MTRYLDIKARRIVRNVHLAICKAFACRRAQDTALYVTAAVALFVVGVTL